MRTLIRCAARSKRIHFICHSRESGNPARALDWKFLFILAIWIPAFAGMTKQALGQNLEHFRHDLDSLFSDTTFSNATFGVAIQSLKTGEYLYRRNDTKSLMPASNMKLFTAAEALALLGPEYRYKTELLTNGKIKGHTLYGDLIVRGVGDPTLGSGFPQELGAPEKGYIFDELRDRLDEDHIKNITGGIIADDTYFTSEVYPNGWQADDMPYYYAPEVTALSVMGDRIRVDINIEENVNSFLEAKYYVESEEDIPVVNHLQALEDTLLSPTVDIARKLNSDTIIITGRMSLRGPDVHQEVSMGNPSFHAVSLLRKELMSNGINVRRRATVIQDSVHHERQELLPLDTDESLPLKTIVRTMNKTSDNLYAECLFRTVAKEIGGEGSWTRGIAVMRKYLATLGTDTTRIQFTDGSGLSRMDLVTADDIVTVLRAMASNPKLDSAYYNSLPIMGVDGTLENRLKGTPAQGNIHAKTGSMTGVRSISGYLTTRDGQPTAFSILANNYTVSGSEIGKLEDEVLLKLVNFSSR